MGLKKEIWEGELLRRLRNADEGHLKSIPDYSNKVVTTKKGATIIHLTDIGADPNVLVDNTVYPIPTAGRTDQDIPLSLNKLETENTEITDDELDGLPWDKENSVIDQHQGTLEESRIELGTHGLAPDANTATTPLVATTGAADPLNALLKKITVADIATLQLKFNVLNIPSKNRVLVLDPRHVRDLTDVDQQFANQFHMIQSGRPVDLYGFKVFMYNANPLYQGDGIVNWAKQPYKTASNQGIGDVNTRHRHCSIAYYAPRMFKAMGNSTMYRNIAEEDTKFRKTEVGFRVYSLIQPKLPQSLTAIDKSPHCIGAIVAEDV